METHDEASKKEKSDFLRSSKNLDIRSCELEHLPAEIFELTGLEVLLVSDNHIQQLQFQITNLVNLKELWLAW
jgi:Leucine-rich repeat (LRR) protein